MKQAILVTGGAGYIGSITSRKLIENGFDVVIVDNLVGGHRKAIPENVNFELANVGNTEVMKEIISKYKPVAIIDFAAYLSVGESMSEPLKYFENNVANFINLLDAMVATGCRYIIKSSSAAVYGNPDDEKCFPIQENYLEDIHLKKSALLNGMTDGKEVHGDEFLMRFLELYKEKTKDRKYLALNDNDLELLRIPTSIYGLTKLLDEICLLKYDTELGIKHVALRYFNVAGADISGNIGEDHQPETHLIPLIIGNILGKNPLMVYGTDYKTADGTAIRDYIHVTDLAQGHIDTLRYLLEKDTSDVFNLGNNKGYSVLEIISMVEKVTGKKTSYKADKRRSGDPERLLACADKIYQNIGWKAQYSLEDMVKTAWQWHQKHPNGYEK